MANMTKDLSEDREALYQMICSLKGEDVQKVVSYVSFLRFVDVYRDKAMADLLKIELAKNDYPKAALDDSHNDADGTYLSPRLQFPRHEDESAEEDASDAAKPEAGKPEVIRAEAMSEAAESALEPTEASPVDATLAAMRTAPGYFDDEVSLSATRSTVNYDEQGIFYEPDRYKHVELFPEPKPSGSLQFGTSPR